MRYGFVEYHTPNVSTGDAVAGKWRFQLGDQVTDFAATWRAAVAVFRADPEIIALARRERYPFNYGDLIDHGQHILARHGLHFLPDAGGETVLVDHDAVLVDPDEE